MDAATAGAKNGVDIVLSIIATLIAFIAFLTFADSTMKWLTYLIGFDDVGIEFLFGKMFIPVAWALGVEWENCEAIGHVIGTRTFVNEFVAFKLLGEYKKAAQITVKVSGEKSEKNFTNSFFRLVQRPSPPTPSAASPILARWES